MIPEAARLPARSRRKAAFVAAFALISRITVAGAPPSVDCNRNGTGDDEDIAARIRFDAPERVVVTDIADDRDLIPSFVITADLDRDGDEDTVVLKARTGHIALIPNVDGRRPGTPVLLGVREPAGLISDDPRSVAVADLDGDGHLDLAVANFATNTVSLLWGRGPFEFEEPESIVVPDGPVSIVPGDFGLDTRTELAVACTLSRDVVFLRGGRGRSVELTTRVAAGSAPSMMVQGDLDADQRPDLVIAAAADDAVTVLWNSTSTPGVPSFSGSTRFDGLDEPASIALADFDRDGRLDVAAANRSAPNVSVFRGRGAREFHLGVNFWAGDRPMAIAPLDYDADGAMDLAVANTSGTGIVLLRNRGDGAFELARSVEPVTSATHVAAADFSRDRFPDLVATTSDPRSVVIWSNRSGGFPVPGNPVLELPLRTFAVGDIDRDGSVDLIVAHWPENVIEAMVQREPASFESTSTFDAAGFVGSLELADLDRDGAPEIIVDAADNRILIARNDGRGGFLPEILDLTRAGDIVAVEDLDGDGSTDLVVRDPGVGIFWLPNDRAGGFRVEDRRMLPAGNPVAFGDLDGDGSIDIVDTTTSVPLDEMLVWLHRGGGSYESRRQARPRNLRGLAMLHDLDGDGYRDLLYPDGDALAVARNRGDGGLMATVTRFPTGSAIGTCIACFAVLDLDLDGRADIALKDSFGLGVLHSTGRFAFLSASGSRLGATMVRYSDFDGDGDDDALVLTDRTLRLIRNETPRPTSRDDNENSVPDECEGRPFHRGDANGDGRVDLADAVRVLAYLFLGDDVPGCREAADIDNDGSIALVDAVQLLDHLFRGGAPPAIPGPSPRRCAPDPDAPGSARDLGCADYTAC